MVEVVFLEMTYQDEYEYLKEVLHKVRIRERGYTEQEAIERIIEHFRQAGTVTIENKTDSQRAEEKQGNR